MRGFPRTRAEPVVHDTTHFAREHGRHTGIGIDDHHRSGSSGRHPCQDGVTGIVDDGGSTDRRADLEFAATGPGGRAAVADRARVGRGDRGKNETERGTD